MKFNKTTCRAALLACALFGLTGCETMEKTVTVAREKISSIDFSLPSFGGSKDEDAASAGEQESAVASALANPDCPPIHVVDELNSMHQFVDEKSTRAEDKLSSLRMTGFTSTCKRNESNVIVDLDIRFEGMLGAKSLAMNTDRPTFAYPYFIAVTAPGGAIVAKEVFGVTVSYDKAQDTVIHEEHLRQVIPTSGDFADGQELLMGFQLTEAELAYNRALATGASAENTESLLSPNEPALVYEGDPAVKDKPEQAAVKKSAPVVKPPQKPVAPPVAAAAEPAAPVPAVAAEPTPAAPVPSEPVPAAVTTEPMPGVTAMPAPAPASAVTAPAVPAAPAATAAPPAAEEEEEPSTIELLEDQTNAPEPPPLGGAAPAPAPVEDITTPPTL